MTSTPIGPIGEDALRALIAGTEGVTPGPWAVNPAVATVDAFDLANPVPVCQMLWPTGERTEAQTEANAAHIAACDPDTIRSICAELLELRAFKRSVEEAVNGWECPECGCKIHARIDERKPSGKFGPGPFVRCVNCKAQDHWPLINSAIEPAPAVPAVEAMGDPKHVDWPPLVELARVLAFYTSVIKSGEPWTATCQAEYDKANVALQRLYASLPERTP